MSETDRLLEQNREYAQDFDRVGSRPRRAPAWPWWHAWTHASTCTGSSASARATPT